MLILKLSKNDPITLYHRTTHQKLGTISINPRDRHNMISLCFDVSDNLKVLRAKAESNLDAQSKRNTASPSPRTPILQAKPK